MSGYVYLIGTPVFGWYKIGKSKTPEVRIKDLGILLPFKIHIIGIWAAKNHTLMESSLHDIYSEKRINGEWFEFSKKEVMELFNYIPSETRIFPTHMSSTSLDKFSNIDEDKKNSKKVIGVRIQKLRGDFTEKEREERKISSIAHQKMRKHLANITNYGKPYQLVCNKPHVHKKVKINIFTSICSVVDS